MGTITVRYPRIFIGADADKSTVIGLPGDSYESPDLGIKYFWNAELSSWDNGHKQRIRCWGRGITTTGVIAPSGTWEPFSTPIYLGSDLEGIIKKVEFYFQLTGGTTVDTRLQDVTNTQTIGQLNGLSGARALYDLGTLSFMPTGKAELEFQIKANSGGSIVAIDSINAEFD